MRRGQLRRADFLSALFVGADDMMFILDNLDSFTYNIAQLTQTLRFSVIVKRASATSIAQIADMKPSHIVLSPGPGRPSDHPFMFDLLEAYGGKVPILGICLGLQAINIHFGGTLKKDDHPMHGKVSDIFHASARFFQGIPSPFPAARYHSLLVDEIAQNCVKTAWTADGSLMALEHESMHVYGMQFHLESFLTPAGAKLLKHFYSL